MGTSVVLDCDLAMGALGSDIDDGFALALALAEPEINLKAVTTVNGNTDVYTATRLTEELLRRLGSPGIPVYRGADRPLLAPLAEQSQRHGFSPTRLPLPDCSEHAANALIRLVHENPNDLTLVAVGPLTNLALAIRLDPSIVALVPRVVVMGGVFFGGTGHADMPGEFNIWVDPDAAQIVIDSGLPLEFVGLDVTRQVRVSRQDAARLVEADTSFSRFAGEYTSAWIDFIAERNPRSAADQDSCAMHDPLAVAAVVHPELIEWVDVHLSFSTGLSVARGVAVTDLLEATDSPAPNCRVARAVDREAFRTYFLSHLSSL